MVLCLLGGLYLILAFGIFATIIYNEWVFIIDGIMDSDRRPETIGLLLALVFLFLFLPLLASMYALIKEYE